MLVVVLLSVIMLVVIILSVIMLVVVMLTVVAALEGHLQTNRLISIVNVGALTKAECLKYYGHRDDRAPQGLRLIVRTKLVRFF